MLQRLPRPNQAGLIAWALFGLTLGVYVSGLPPSITWSNAAADSGELAAAVATWGVPHPPGYPTYVLAGKLFSQLPFGDIAYRLSLMSALAGAAAVAFTFQSARVMLRLLAGHQASPTATHPTVPGWASSALLQDAAALVAALSLGSAPIFWGQAIVAEVYAPSAFVVALGTYLLLTWSQAARAADRRVPGSRLIGAAFVLGLGMGSHYTVAGVLAPLGAASLWRARRQAHIPWAGMVLGLALGLALFIYLPVAASRNPPINWGDPSNLSGFVWDVTARPYRGYVYGIDSGLWDDRLGDWAKRMVDQYQGVGIVLGIIGFWRLWRWDRVIAGALGVAFLGLSSYSAFYLTGDSFVFLVPALFVGALAVGAGAYVIAAETVVPAALRARDIRWAPAGVLGVAAAVVALTAGVTLARNAGDFDLREDRQASEYARAVFDGVEPGAIVLADVDQPLFALWYRRFVVERDPQVAVVARNLLQYDWYVGHLRRREPDVVPLGLTGSFDQRLTSLVLRHVQAGRPVYSTFADPILQSAFVLDQKGAMYKVLLLSSVGSPQRQVGG